MRVFIGDYGDKREVSVELHDYDTWSMDVTLALIIHPLLIKFKADLTGCPSELIDYPIDGVIAFPYTEPDKTEEDDSVDKAMVKWKEILDKMIWSFGEIVNNEENEPPYVKGNFDKEAYLAYHNRLQEGLDLFGKHFRSLWN